MSKMIVNELVAELNLPDALPMTKDKDGKEVPSGLPPYARVKAHVVDEYPACPSSWMNGSDISSSYFVPVKAGKGMWLDFNGCHNHNHEVAVVISVQGVNPINGQKQNVMRLEQYKTNCPIHDKTFKQDRFCEDCGFKWPAQNYLATTGTPHGQFWIDGFRSENGQVRQYIFTEEEAKGVASQLIGDDKVYAIGIAFYLSKEKKKVKSESTTSSAMGKPLSSFHDLFEDMWGKKGPASSTLHTNSITRNSIAETPTSKGIFRGSNSDVEGTIEMPEMTVCTDTNTEEIVVDKKLEVGLGSSINQEVNKDTESLDFWQDKPAGFIYINYCTQDQCEKILAAGKRKEKKGGFTNGLLSVINE